MWYEILPSALIITVALAAPSFGMYGIHKLVLGNAYRRNLDSEFECWNYRRDYRLTGNPYIMNGLNEIPDDEENQEEQIDLQETQETDKVEE